MAAMSLLSRRPQISTALKPFLRSAFSSCATTSSDETRSFTVSYLIDSCKLSPESAIAASKKVQLESSRNPDAVLAFLRAHDFSEAQIATFVSKRPKFLLSNPEKTFLPKIEFFYSKGISRADLVKVLCSRPFVLERSLRNYIEPTYGLLRSVLSSDKELVSTTVRHRASLVKHWKNVAANLGLMRELGFDESVVGSTLRNFPALAMVDPVKFGEMLKKVKGMGFHRESHIFMHAMHAFCSPGLENRWRGNYDIYRRWGWSDDDILAAFRYHPSCMILSEKRLTTAMEFLVNVMKWPSLKIAKIPIVLLYSFQKRILPRCSVIRVLLAKGLMEQETFSLISVLKCVENRFLANYVVKYLNKVPNLMSVYQGTLKPEDA